jgi:hypothetical protein
MTNPAIVETVAVASQEELTLSGYGFRMVVNGHAKPQIFNDKNEPVIDVNERMAAQRKLVLPLVQKLGASWQQELADLAAATQTVTALSSSVTQAFTANDNAPKKRELGDKVEDGSYYVGVSKTTGTDLFLFIESVGQNKHVDVVSFNKGTEIMRQKHKQGAEFHGHKFSAQQLENEIVAAQNEGTADGGIRRLTKAELAQVEEVFEAKPELREMALEVCKDDRWVQSASPCVSFSAWFQYLDGGDQYLSNRSYDASLLGGRSLPRPKP